MTPSELQLYFMEAANVCNNRPLGIDRNKTIPESGVYKVLTPNSLLLSRNSGNPAEMDTESFGSKNKRMELVKSCQDYFWKRWCQEVTPDWFTQHKWMEDG